MKIWYDVRNICEVNFLKTLILSFPNHEFVVTVRDYAKADQLLETMGISFTKVGGHSQGNLISKFITTIFRMINLMLYVPPYDVSIGRDGFFTLLVSKLRNKPSILFSQAGVGIFERGNYLFRLADYLVCPKHSNLSVIKKIGINKEKIFFFDGWIELLSINDYKPNSSFLSQIGLSEGYILFRPPAYHSLDVSNSSTKKLIRFTKEVLLTLSLTKKQILFVGRYENDNLFTNGIKNVTNLNSPVNGLDLIWFSSMVVTGSGTFAREAAGLSKKSVSFYDYSNYDDFLPVDKYLISNNKIFNSLNSSDIYRHITNTNVSEGNKELAVSTKNQILSIVREIFNSHDPEKNV